MQILGGLVRCKLDWSILGPAECLLISGDVSYRRPLSNLAQVKSRG